MWVRENLEVLHGGWFLDSVPCNPSLSVQLKIRSCPVITGRGSFFNTAGATYFLQQLPLQQALPHLVQQVWQFSQAHLSLQQLAAWVALTAPKLMVASRAMIPSVFFIGIPLF